MREGGIYYVECGRHYIMYQLGEGGFWSVMRFKYDQLIVCGALQIFMRIQ